MLVRGGTSKGAYFLAEDLPNDVEERDDLLLRIMGSPDSQQIDGIGGAHPLTSKVAIVHKSSSTQSDVDFLFAQVSVQDALVDTKSNCGNTLAGVGAFAIERACARLSASGGAKAGRGDAANGAGGDRVVGQSRYQCRYKLHIEPGVGGGRNPECAGDAAKRFDGCSIV